MWTFTCPEEIEQKMCTWTYDKKGLYNLHKISTIVGAKKTEMFENLQNEIETTVDADNDIDYNINIQKLENEFFKHIKKHDTIQMFFQRQHIFKGLLPLMQQLSCYYNQNPKSVVIEKKNSISTLSMSKNNGHTTYYNGGPGNKVWYILPPSETKFFNALCKNLINVSRNDNQKCDNVSIHNAIVPAPNFLKRYKIKYHRIIQFPREMVIFCPFTYYFGFTTDNIAADMTNYFLPELAPLLKYEYLRNIYNDVLCDHCMQNERIKFAKLLSLDALCITCRALRENIFGNIYVNLTIDDKDGDDDDDDYYDSDDNDDDDSANDNTKHLATLSGN